MKGLPLCPIEGDCAIIDELIDQAKGLRMDTRYDFPVTPEYPLEDVRRVQKRLLEMAVFTSDVLKEAGIKHSLALGSLLGAVRHKGFIPWDDDLDFWVEDERYEEALELLRERVPNDMIIHDQLTDPIYWPEWSRVRDLKSETIFSQYSNDNHYKYRGVCVDLYRMYVVDETELPYFWLRKRLANVQAKFERGILREDEVKEYYDWIDGMWQRGFIEYQRRFHGQLVTDDFGWELEEVGDFFPLGEMEFEGVMFPVPKNPYPLLDAVFRDKWREPPAFEERLCHYSQVKFF